MAVKTVPHQYPHVVAEMARFHQGQLLTPTDMVPLALWTPMRGESPGGSWVATAGLWALSLAASGRPFATYDTTMAPRTPV